jgi:hypothetical protein
MWHWWKGSVHQAVGSFINHSCGERDKGGTAPPLSIPAAPRGNRCCALRSPPACLTAAGSTRLARPFRDSLPVSVRLCPPSMASRPCHSRFGSPISAGTHPLAFILQIKAKPVSLELRFCRPDKRQRHPALSLRHRLPDGGSALSGLRGFSGSVTSAAPPNKQTLSPSHFLYSRAPFFLRHCAPNPSRITQRCDRRSVKNPPVRFFCGADH